MRNTMLETGAQGVNLEPTPEAMRERWLERLAANRTAFTERYRAIFGNHFNPDNAAEMFEEYSQSADARARYRIAVSPAAGALAGLAFAQRLAEHDRAPVVFMAGGTASFKSTIACPEAHRGKIVFDSTFSNYELSKERLLEALNAGRVALVHYLYRDPLEAWASAKERARMEGGGRRVTTAAHALTHEGAASTVRRLAAEFGGSARVAFLYSGVSAANGLEPSGIELTRKGDYSNLEERLKEYDANATEASA